MVGLSAVLDILELAKSQGKIRMVGVSSGNIATLETALSNPLYEVVQTPVNPASAGLRHVWDQCSAQGILLMGNQVFFSGNHPAGVDGTTHETLFRYARAICPSACLLVGTKRIEHFRQCLEWDNHPLESDEIVSLEARVARN